MQFAVSSGGARKTKKTKKTKAGSRGQTLKIQHHHFLLRMETKTCPGPGDKADAKALVKRILKDIHMNLLGDPRVFYVKIPHFNEGLTALAPIQTSHVAFHFWKNPDLSILQNPESECLLQFDLYTCGTLSLKQLQHILRHLTVYKPTHVNATLLNRNYDMTLERQLLWDTKQKQGSWSEWVKSIDTM